jgi:hypothetical protein
MPKSLPGEAREGQKGGRGGVLAFGGRWTIRLVAAGCGQGAARRSDAAAHKGASANTAPRGGTNTSTRACAEQPTRDCPPARSRAARGQRE